MLTIFQSPFGRYCFQRLPVGLSVSQNMFKLKTDKILQQVDGTVGIADDIAVCAKDDKEHSKVLHHLFRVAKENGLLLNSSECKIKTGSITFFAMKYDANGMHPDPQKAADLDNKTTPISNKELQTFFGFVQFLAPFIPNLAEKSSVLCKLPKEGVPFIWEIHY